MSEYPQVYDFHYYILSTCMLDYVSMLLGELSCSVPSGSAKQLRVHSVG